MSNRNPISVFEQFVQRIAAVPKEAVDRLEAEREKRPPRKRKRLPAKKV